MEKTEKIFDGDIREGKVIQLFRKPALSETKEKILLEKIRETVPQVERIETEFCFNIGAEDALNPEEFAILRWLLTETFEPENFSQNSLLRADEVLEVGPRLNFATPYSTNAVSICQDSGLSKINRIERSRRYLIKTKESLNENQRQIILFLLYDRMTECQYTEPIKTFGTGIKPTPVWSVPIIEKGVEVLKRVNREFGLGMDEWDILYYYNLFTDVLRRNPTIVEVVQLGNANSEHSRHHFFKGKLIIDNKEIPVTLLDIVKQPWRVNPNNSLIAFSDNSSVIRGFEVPTIIPDSSGKFRMKKTVYCLLFTAETHNYPSGVDPVPGAETGTGGRLRDVVAMGQGGLPIAGTTGYCDGNLRIPGYELPWEDSAFRYPHNLASPLEIEIGASNGASDYGNKFGEPLILGFTRSFDIRLPSGERYGYIKPIMFTGGVGQISDEHLKKAEPEKGMLVVRVGGPAYRIGMSGGAASSMIQGENIAELDYNAVQRGDAEMENKMNRPIRTCIEKWKNNPIKSIHDQGAGGPSNVLTELVDPAGAKINIRKINVGDKTLSVLEIWCAEFQESNCLLIEPGDVEEFQRTCQREKVSCEILGEITGDGKMVVFDENDGTTPVKLDLEAILGKMPQKTFKLETIQRQLSPLELPKELTIRAALERVLRLLSVGSKRFLTKKVDRSVTGLIARQQTVGPCQLTLCDMGVVANSHFSLTGIASSIGEQPIKGLINPAAMARLSVGEALTNIVWAKLSRLEDIKCSANWMWAAKLPGEGVRIYEAAKAMEKIMIELGIAVDGGKDSLSMAAQVPNPDGTTEIVKAPGTLVISAYAPCPDIRLVITPDIKEPEKSKLMFIDLAKGKQRLGGSALAQVLRQIGDESPDVDNSAILKLAFIAIQEELIEKNLILAGHDRSDGGLITCLLEMAFAGNCGFNLDFSDNKNNPLKFFFNEELGVVIEYLSENEKEIKEVLESQGLDYKVIGKTTILPRVKIEFNKQTVLDEDMRILRDIWEETSSRIDEIQATPETAREERRNIFSRLGMKFKLTFYPELTPKEMLENNDKPKVAILREEGTNSDREMASAFWLAGFEPWDVAMTDLLEGRINLKDFRGVAFCGGFSYADVLDAGKGWAGVINFNSRLRQQFEEFYQRPDTFSLGVCNGCQVMALLGWAPWQGIETEKQPRFIRNKSEIFESRFVSVKILPSPSIFLRGMEESILGIWVAHSEGRFYCKDGRIIREILRKNLAPIRFVDDGCYITEEYPFNPNGSLLGITALSSADGRHLALMPHPERTFLPWQWAWLPPEFKNLKASPWLRLFQNVRIWCEQTSL